MERFALPACGCGLDGSINSELSDGDVPPPAGNFAHTVLQ
jgi:hypothetical protein